MLEEGGMQEELMEGLHICTVCKVICVQTIATEQIMKPSQDDRRLQQGPTLHTHAVTVLSDAAHPPGT